THARTWCACRSLHDQPVGHQVQPLVGGRVPSVQAAGVGQLAHGRDLLTGCKFSGMQKLLAVAMAYVKRGRRKRCGEKNTWHAVSATRGRIGQVSDLERRDFQTRRAPNACFPMAGAPWVTTGSQAGRKSRRTVDNHSRTLCEEKLESS